MIDRSNSVARIAGPALLALACASSLFGQFAGPSIPVSTAGGQPMQAPVQQPAVEPRIQAGDILSIYTYGVPELTTSAQVQASSLSASVQPTIYGIKVGFEGQIVLPYLGVVKVEGLSSVEATALLKKLLKDGGYLSDPQLTLQIVDSPNRSIAVIGEVQHPQPVPNSGHLHLLDAIAAAGGFTIFASHEVSIRRAGLSEPIVVQLGPDPKQAASADLTLLPGDTVLVPRVGSAYVLGQVKTQSTIPLAGNAPVTVLRAVALAGGVNYGAALSKARIIRTGAANQRIEILLDLKKIMYGEQQDVALMADDVLFVPTNAFKASLAAGAAGVATSAIFSGVQIATLAR